MSTLAWEAVLTDLATRVELAEHALDEGLELDPLLLQPWTPPEGLGPLPQRLRDRAVGVLAQQADIEQRINSLMEQLGRDIAKSTASNRKVSSYGDREVPKFFDSAV